MVSSHLLLHLLFLLLLFAGVAACSRGYTPRPEGYLRIDLPEKSYRTYDSLTPYECEIPRYAIMERVNSSDSGFTWWNLSFPGYHATLYLTYAPIQSNLSSFTADSRRMTYAHAQKANAIDEYPFSYPDRDVYGMMFKVKGDVATAVQFYITDSVHHFLRGALYFPVAPNQDSLAPVVDFFSQDIERIVQTLRWRP